jgi:hypothetical protein
MVLEAFCRQAQLSTNCSQASLVDMAMVGVDSWLARQKPDEEVWQDNLTCHGDSLWCLGKYGASTTKTVNEVYIERITVCSRSSRAKILVRGLQVVGVEVSRSRVSGVRCVDWKCSDLGGQH